MNNQVIGNIILESSHEAEVAIISEMVKLKVLVLSRHLETKTVMGVFMKLKT